jgi:hypothetical protein
MQTYIQKLYRPIIKALGWTPKGTHRMSLGAPQPPFVAHFIYQNPVVVVVGGGAQRERIGSRCFCGRSSCPTVAATASSRT